MNEPRSEGLADWKFTWGDGTDSSRYRLQSLTSYRWELEYTLGGKKYRREMQPGDVFAVPKTQTSYAVNFQFKHKNMNTFEIEEKDGSKTQYAIDHNGVIKQLYPKPFVYDSKYVGIYDTPDYKRKSTTLQRLRLAFTEAMYDGEIGSLLDVGYGNGAFLSHVRSNSDIQNLYGFDISGVPVPAGCLKAESIPMPGDVKGVDVITFWDCLEHFADLSFVKDIDANMIVLSLPCSKFHDLNYWPANSIDGAAISWFKNWHHRKPNEHLHHFDKTSLRATMAMYGWKMLWTTSMEDMIRKSREQLRGPNILTAAFKRK